MNRPTVRAALVAALVLSTASNLRAQIAPSPAPPLPAQQAVAEPQPAPPPPVPPADDHTSILRFDPFENKLIAVPPAEVKPGFLYNRFNERLGRRVWTIAIDGGGFNYAMGEGTTEPAIMLDLRGTEQQRRAAVERAAPTLVETLRQRGGTVYVRLNAAQGWELVPRKTIASVWDLETLERWEWHGSRRVAVLHTFGNSWTRVEGRYVPATLYASFPCEPL